MFAAARTRAAAWVRTAPSQPTESSRGTTDHARALVRHAARWPHRHGQPRPVTLSSGPAGQRPDAPAVPAGGSLSASGQSFWSCDSIPVAACLTVSASAGALNWPPWNKLRQGCIDASGAPIPPSHWLVPAPEALGEDASHRLVLELCHKTSSSFVSGPPGNVARQSCHADALLLPETFVGVTYIAIVHTRMTYTCSVSTNPSPSSVSGLSFFPSNDFFPCVITPYYQCDLRRAQSLAFMSGSREQPLPHNSTAHRDLEHAAAVAQKPRQRPMFA